MTDGLLVVLALFALAGGGIIVIDSLIIRRLRRGKDTTDPEREREP